MQLANAVMEIVAKRSTKGVDDVEIRAEKKARSRLAQDVEHTATRQIPKIGSGICCEIDICQCEAASG